MASVREIITQVANRLGVPADLAIAIAQVESGLNPRAIGDGGHSVGLFQLHDQGEGAGMSVQERMDPVRNAEVALSQVARVLREHPDWSPGDVAAAAQRPADRRAYAQAVNRVLAGGSGGGAVATDSTDTVHLSEEDLAAKAGYALAFFNLDPQLKDLLKQAVENDWSPDRLKMAIMNTPWYRTHAQSVRDYLALKASDPATFTAQLKQKMEDIKQLADQMGAVVDVDHIYRIADDAMRLGLDDNQIRVMLGSFVNLAESGGQAATNVQSMRQYAEQMGVNLSPTTLQQYEILMAQGRTNMDTFMRDVRELAKSTYPGFAKQIDAGLTMQNIADPYIQSMASLLELNPATITLSDPTIRKALTGTRNPDGSVQVPTLFDFEQQLRQDPRWQYTKNAHDAAYSMLRTIGQTWGFIS